MGPTRDPNSFDALSEVFSTRTRVAEERQRALNAMLEIDPHRAAPLVLRALQIEMSECARIDTFQHNLARELSIARHPNAVQTIQNLRDRAVHQGWQHVEEIAQFLTRIYEATEAEDAKDYLSRLLARGEKSFVSYTCWHCKGKGYSGRCSPCAGAGGTTRKCDACGGTTKVTCDLCNGKRAGFFSLNACRKCHGALYLPCKCRGTSEPPFREGFIVDVPCGTCRGTGRRPCYMCDARGVVEIQREILDLEILANSFAIQHEVEDEPSRPFCEIQAEDLSVALSSLGFATGQESLARDEKQYRDDTYHFLGVTLEGDRSGRLEIRRVSPVSFVLIGRGGYSTFDAGSKLVESRKT